MVYSSIYIILFPYKLIHGFLRFCYFCYWGHYGEKIVLEFSRFLLCLMSIDDAFGREMGKNVGCYGFGDGMDGGEDEGGVWGWGWGIEQGVDLSEGWLNLLICLGFDGFV